MGNRMSGGESCAMTLPSTNSTIECTTLSGWITTSSCSGSSSKSQRASITSSALFIRVAESIVILGPIRQVGCLRASSGVTSVSSLRVRPRNGPPDEVRMTRRTSWRAPAFERLKDGRVLAVNRQDLRSARAGQLHDERPGDDERLFVGQGDDLAGFESRPGPSQSDRPDDRAQDAVGLGVLRPSG